MPRLTLLVSLALLVLALGAPAQRGRAEPPEPPVYPFEPIPVDALRGHLLEGPFKQPTGLFFDAEARELFVCDGKNGLIGVYEPDGRPVFSFGGPAQLRDPKRVHVTPDGTVYVLDTEQLVVKPFSYRGERLPPISFEYPPLEEEDEEWGTARVGCFTIDQQGQWYVGDLDRPQILVYGPDLDFLFAIRPSRGGARFSIISSVAVSAEGLIAATDFKATPVQVFDARGNFVRGFGGRDIAREDFTAPVSVTFDEEGRLFVVDMLRHDVKIFDINGTFLGQFGGWFGPETGGRAPGEMLYPVDIAIEPGGLIYVAERFGNRVQLFERVPLEEAPRLRIPRVGRPDGG
jgi:DNA-binding beta-propeller fold protein YncE